MDDSTKDDVAKIFRESENLGHDSSLLLRPMRRLMMGRKPPGLVTPLAFGIGDEPIGYFGVLYTGRNRISFWPAYPSGTDMTQYIDHVTLELPSGKSHGTRYDANGDAHRSTAQGAAWRLIPFADSPIALWFPLLMRWDTLLKQDKLLQRVVDGKSSSGGKHVEEAFTRYAEGVQQPIMVPLHPACAPPNYVLCTLCYASNCPYTELEFRSEMFATEGVSALVRDWNPDSQIQVQAVRFARGGHSFVAAAACPPGELDDAVAIGLSRRLH